MYIEFDKEYLRELFDQGRTSDKKHRYQPEVIRGYQKAVFALISANCVADLFRNNALNYEVYHPCGSIANTGSNSPYGR